ncbi:MAG TPA: DNA methyltransferase [Verrucomicrobiae bacterium]|jgi:DNA modification methylase|nr:DNA methyltransferase [Verrucomicrobiae bacterium]
MNRLFHANCFDWLRKCPPRSIQAVCTDPPYGLLEFTEKEVGKLRAGRGGVWRLPPVIGGSRRDPLPRFTILTADQKKLLRSFFGDWGGLLFAALVPGAHVCVAGHPILQYLVQDAMAQAGYEVRPAVMRLYFSFRGGDRPKNAEQEFPEVCVSPKGAYEPWMLFRKPIETKTVAENLRQWRTGGLRRLSVDKPLPEVIPSGRTPDREEAISHHPCLKPQHFMRIIVRALLPLGEGKVLDPFMGSGSTIAAAEAVGYDSIGIELDEDYFKQSQAAIPRLAALYPSYKGESMAFDVDYKQTVDEPHNQLSFGLAESSAVYSVKVAHAKKKIATAGISRLKKSRNHAKAT